MPRLVGVASLLAMLALTQYLAYQRYLISKEKEHKALMRELINARSKFRSVLHNNITVANTLVIICKEYGFPADFDHIAADIMKTSKYIDALQLLDKGVISHVYPLTEENKTLLGLNTFEDPMRKEEALRALQKKGVSFAGPRTLRYGGEGLIGKAPIFVNGELKGFSTVLTKMPTIHKALELDQKSKNIFAYSLIRTSPGSNGTPTVYPLSAAVPKNTEPAISLPVPEGDWIFSVTYSTEYAGAAFPIELSLLGTALSIAVALLVYRKMREPETLKKEIELKTRQIANSEKYYRTLIETSSDAIALIDSNGETIYQTPSVEKITGYSLAEMKEIKGVNLVHPDDLAKDNEEFLQLLQAPGSTRPHKHRVRKKNGSYIWVEGTYRNLLHDESVRAIVYNYTDVTDRYASLEQISKYNLELTLLNSVNDIVLHAEEKNALFDEVCQCIVNVGKYKLAWVAEAHENISRAGELTLSAASGDVAYLNAKLAAGWNHRLTNNPIISALQANEPAIINNTDTSPEFAEWSKDAKHFGIGSVIILPLGFNNSRGTLNIYSARHGEFGVHERSIFKRLAENISLAVRSIQDRNDKEAGAAQLKKRVKELSTIYQLNNTLLNEKQGVDDIFSAIANTLPEGWQYPEACAARIDFDGKTYQTNNYAPSDQSQAASFLLHDGRRGLIEVVYLEKQAAAYEGPFLKEERDLIETICSTIEIFLNKRIHKEALTKSEANLRSIFDSTDIGYILLDANLDIVAFNNYIRINYPKHSGVELHVGGNFITFVEADKKARFASVCTDVMAGNKPVEYETRYGTDEDPAHFWVNIVPVRNNEQVVGLCLVTYEITQLKNLELERERIINDLTQRNTNLEQFAQIVSHNLRGPLSTILGLNMLLEDPMPEKEKDTLIKDIRVASNRLDTVIMDLNEILEARSKISEPKSIIDLHALVKEVQDSLSTAVRDSGTMMNLDFAAVRELRSIKSPLYSVFYNLITNSIKFAKPDEKPAVNIWTEHQGQSVIIYYKDNSRGIALDRHRDKVFQLYQRFHLDIEGKGLGLFMIKTQVETLDGNIAIDSAAGDGCLFTITLPS